MEFKWKVIFSGWFQSVLTPKNTLTVSLKDCFIFFLWFGLDIVEKKNLKKTFFFYYVDIWFWMETAIMKLKLYRFQLFRYLQRDLLLEVNFSFNINELLRKKSEAAIIELNWMLVHSVCYCVGYNCSQTEHSLWDLVPCVCWDLGEHPKIEFCYSLNVGESLNKPKCGCHLFSRVYTNVYWFQSS